MINLSFLSLIIPCASLWISLESPWPFEWQPGRCVWVSICQSLLKKLIWSRKILACTYCIISSTWFSQSDTSHLQKQSTGQTATRHRVHLTLHKMFRGNDSTLPNLIRIKKSDRVAHGPIFQTYTTSPTMLLEMYGLAAGRMQRSLICLKIYQYWLVLCFFFFHHCIIVPKIDSL